MSQITLPAPKAWAEFMGAYLGATAKTAGRGKLANDFTAAELRSAAQGVAVLGLHDGYLSAELQGEGYGLTQTLHLAPAPLRDALRIAGQSLAAITPPVGQPGYHTSATLEAAGCKFAAPLRPLRPPYEQDEDAKKPDLWEKAPLPDGLTLASCDALTGPGWFRLDGAEFAAALRFAASSQSNEETRYYLNGVYLHHPAAPGPIGCDLSTVRLVATDGHRLTMGDASSVASAGQGDTAEAPLAGVILPRAAVAVLLHLMRGDGAAGPVWINASEKAFVIQGAAWRVWGKPVDGTFPDYTRVLPQRSGAGSIGARALLDALQPFLRSYKRSVEGHDAGVILQPDADLGAVGALILKTALDDPRELHAAVPGFTLPPNANDFPSRVGFTTAYIRDMLASVAPDRKETVEFWQHAKGDPAGFKFSAHPSFVGVLMPRRI